MGLEKATPFNYQRGTKDNSAVALTALPKTYPQFLPTFFLETQRGGYDTERVTGNLAEAIYGFETFNLLGKYANHASVFAAGVLGAAGQVLIKRLPYRPVAGEDGIANITIWLTLTTTTSTESAYVRDASGNIVVGANGLPTFDTTKPVNVLHGSLSAKPITTIGTKPSDLVPITTVGGFTVNGVALDTVSYPLYSFKAIGHGVDYNNIGLGFTTLTGNELVGSMFANNELAHAIAMYYNDGTRQLIENKDAATYTIFGTKADSVHPTTGVPNSLSDVFPSYYGFKPDPTGTRVLSDFQDVYVHQAHIDTVLRLIASTELSGSVGANQVWSDFNATDAANATALTATLFRLSNLFTNKYSSGKKYEYVRFSSDVVQSAALITAVGNPFSGSLETPVYLQGGLDNVLGDTVAEESAMLTELYKYADPDAKEADLAINYASAFIDSGYTADTKMKLGKFLSYRKDVMLLTSPYEVDGVDNINGRQSLTNALGIASLMKATYRLNPESSLFGTETSKASIMLGSGNVANAPFRKRVPLLYDLVIKLTRLAGASNGKWNPVYKFSRQPGNFVTEITNIDPEHIGNSVKDNLWNSGLIWAQNEDRDTYFYPSTQTIYSDDTSVLNILLVNLALCYIAKQEEAIWREFTGADDLTNPQLKILGEQSLNNRLAGKFADMYRLVPEIFFTPADVNRGYSWKLVVHLYAPNMKTVQESYTIVHRLG